jgi:hypothetical protein
MDHQKQVLQYCEPEKRAVWPWVAFAILLGLAISYGIALWYVNTYGS